MTRSLDVNTANELSESEIRIGYLFSLAFDSTTIYLSSTGNDINWNNKSWISNDWFQGWDSIVEDEDLDTDELTIFLSGVSSSLISSFLSDVTGNNRGEFYLCLYTENWQIVGEPVLLFKGLLDEVEITEEADDCNMEVTFESDLSIIDKSSNIRWTDEFQRQRFSGDAGFEHVVNLQDWAGYFGKAKTEPPTEKDSKNERRAEQTDKKKGKKKERRKERRRKRRQKERKKRILGRF